MGAKRRKLLAFLLVVAMCCSGCGTISKLLAFGDVLYEVTNKQVKYKKQIGEVSTYLNNKYDDSFVFKDFYGGDAYENFGKKLFIFESEKYPELPVIAGYGHNYETYIDNYIPVKYADDAEQKFEEILDQVFGKDNYIITTNLVEGLKDPYEAYYTCGNDYNPNMTFDEYISGFEFRNSTCWPEVYVSNKAFVNQTDTENKCAEAIRASGFDLPVTKIYFTDNLESIDLSELEEEKKDDDFTYRTYEHTSYLKIVYSQSNDTFYFYWE